MVISHNVSNIVMVTKIEVGGRIKCNVYFPDPVHSKETFQVNDDVSVKLIGVDKSNKFFEVRRFEISDRRSGEKRILNHFWVLTICFFENFSFLKEKN